MANKSSNLRNILGAGVAAAGAATGMATAPQSADAALVYSGVVNINIATTTAGVYLNLATAVNNPAPGLVPGWDVNPWGTTALNMFSPSPQPAGGTYVGTGTTFSNLAFGTVINAASTYSTSTGTSTLNPATPLNLNSDNNCVGIRFINETGGGTHFGWLRIALSGTQISQPRAIVGYAWDNVAGTAVTACVVPEPTSLCLLALGAAGLVTRRRK